MNEQLDRLEGMITQLVSTVGNIMETQTVIRTDLNKITERLGGLESRMDSMDSRMDRIESRMDSVESRMDRIESRMDSMESRMDGIESRIDSIEKKSIDHHQEVMQKLNSLEADQEHIWQKAIRNEREFARFKHQYGF